MRRFRIASIAAAFVLAIAIAGCSSSGSTASSASSTSPSSTPGTALGSPTTSAPATTGAATITIHNFSFGTPITVAPGATVTVHNADPTTHSLSSDGGAFDAGNIPAGHTVTFVAPSKPGAYKFHCNFHANMHSTLFVVG